MADTTQTVKAVTDSVDHLAKELNVQLVHYAPEAWRILCAVKQAESIGTLISSGLWLAFGIVIAILTYRWSAYCWRKVGNDNTPRGDEGCWNFGGTMTALGCIGSTTWSVCSLATITSPWLWIGAFAPQVAVAHDIIQKIVTPGS